MNRRNHARAGFALGVSTLALMFAAGGPALAADVDAGAGAPPAAGGTAKADDKAAQVQEVVVTGFRSSLAKAINQKRVSTSEIDTILAEDIGKFPDLNLAESLQRVPGVAINREGGEGRQITVRGLGPQYTRVRIDGMEALSSTGGPDNDGGVNRTRNFDFNIFASDLFTQLTVRKTQEADVDEGSLGATVDLRPARPFDYNKLTFIAQAKGDYNDLAGSVGPRASALVADTFFDNTFGVLASVAYSKRDFIDDGASTVRWDQANQLATTTNPYGASPYGFASVLGTPCTGTASTLPAVCQTADSALHPRFPRYDYYQDQQTRVGATLSLQWRATSRDLFSLDLMHSYFGGWRQERYLEAPGLSGTGKCTNATINTSTSVGCINVLSETINAQGVMTAGSFTGVDTRVEERYDELHTNFDQATLHGEHHWTSRLSVDELFGVSRSNFQNPIQTTLGYDQYNQAVSYNFGSKIPYLNFGSENVGASGPWVLTEVRERPQSTINKYETAQVNLHWIENEHLTLSAGVNYKQYDFSTTSERLVNGETVSATNVYASLRSYPISSYASTLNYGGVSGVSVPAGSTTTFATPSVALAQNLFGLYTNPLFALSTAGDLGNNTGVIERDYGAYIQADFKLSLIGRPLRGNVGLREVTTAMSSSGYSPTLLPISGNHKYHDGLPSLNLVWEVRNDALVRFSAGRAMTRPDLTSLVASTSLSVSGANYTVKTGNPALAPFLANAYDLAFEWYPQRGALYSLALFRKDIVSLVTSNTFHEIFHGNSFGIPDSVAVAACNGAPGCSANIVWAFSAPANTAGGTVNGLEINIQQPLTFLPWAFKHTGVLLNYTAVDSSVLYPNGATFVTGQLLGLSRSSANATLYYEDGPWSARVSGSYRSKYLTKVPGQEVGTDADGFDPTFNLDTSIQYQLNRHLKLSVEGVNLTNQYESQFNDTRRDLPTYYHQTGREILFGVRYQY